MGGLSGGGGSNTVTERADPWSGQQPYLQHVMSEAQRQYMSPGPSYYPGKLVSNFAPEQLQSMQYMSDYARTAQPYIDQYQKGSLYGMQDALDVADNPYVVGMADATTRPVEDWLNERLAQERGDAMTAGNYHSSVRGIREGKALADAAEAMADARANVFGQAYGRGLGAYGASLAAGPTALSMGAYPGQALGQVGAAKRAQDQAYLDDAKRRFDYYQNLPESKLGQYSRMIQGQYGGTTQRDTESGSSLAASMLGGGLLGYGALGPAIQKGASSLIGMGPGSPMLERLAGAWGPWAGAALGAIGGGLFG